MDILSWKKDIPFIINGKYKIYGNLWNIGTNTWLFRDMDTINDVLSANYINLTIDGISFNNTFTQIWRYINNQRDGRFDDLSVEEKMELPSLFRLFNVKRVFIDKLLALHGSFGLFRYAVINTIHTVGNSDISDATNKAAYYVAGAGQNVVSMIIDSAVGKTPYEIVRNAANATLRRVNATMTLTRKELMERSNTIITLSWKETIKADTVIQSKMVDIEIEDLPFNPSAVITDTGLLDVDISSLIPMVRCWYLYSMWELLQLIPFNKELNAKLQTLIDEHKCRDIFNPVIIPLSLSPLLRETHGDTALALRTLVGEYSSREPTREEVMQRLLKME